jgi:hypothetical protein
MFITTADQEYTKIFCNFVRFRIFIVKMAMLSMASRSKSQTSRIPRLYQSTYRCTNARKLSRVAKSHYMLSRANSGLFDCWCIVRTALSCASQNSGKKKLKKTSSVTRSLGRKNVLTATYACVRPRTPGRQ